MSDHMNEEQVKLWRKSVFSCLLGLLLIGIMIYLDTTLNRLASNLMLIEIIKVGGWMFLWNGLQTFVYDFLPGRQSNHLSKQDQSKKTVSEQM